MKMLNWEVVILTVIILTGVSFAGTYSGGFGTEADPYQIGTVADWQELMAESNDWDANFIMTADINLQGVSLTPVGGLSLGNNYMPLFKGIFDGNGHVIRNPTIISSTSAWHIGLFGLIDSNSQIRNLGVENVNMAGERDIAGLVGLSEGTITNCYATGKIGRDISYLSSSVNPGGLVGLNRGTIIGCHADCDINGGYSGGLVGRNEGGAIFDSYAAGTVGGYYYIPGSTNPLGSSYVGGLVGWNIGGTIIDSHADGEVNGIDYVGGLVGCNTAYYDSTNNVKRLGTIVRCYAKGSVRGRNGVGGLIGANILDPSGMTGGMMCLVTDCYATGAVTGGSGLVGINDLSQIINCYAAGRINGSGPGLVGYGGYTKNCFWDIEATGQTKSASGTGKTTAEMMTRSTFTSAGWDFIGETTNGPNDVWFIREGKEYPRLAWENNKPIADAGPNQITYAWIDGIAEVTLDANSSSDADGDTLAYLWKWSIDGNTYEANDVNLIIDLPAGQYTFELIVNDGIADSEPNQVMITVVAPIKSTLWITPQIINSGCFGQKNFMAIVQLPAGISKKQVDANEKLICYPGEIKASRQFVMSFYDCKRVERVVIWAYFDSNSLTDAVSKTGWVNLDVVGQLKTGRYFRGSDKVWVVTPPRKPVWNWPRCRCGRK
jgi:hypothetical protein